LESAKPVIDPLASPTQKWQGRNPQTIMGD
jgi:hypothetical protein